MILIRKKKTSFLSSSDRPSRHVFVLCNPYCGARRSRNTYNTKIKTMLDSAKYKITYTGKIQEELIGLLNDVYVEIDDHWSADDALENFDGDFDSIDRYEKNSLFI